MRAARDWWVALLLFGVLLLAYYPALHGTPIWDDAAHLTRPELRSWTGLCRIWFDPGATQQYYPLTYSVFWLLHRLWGDWHAGYHLVNILLHAGSALLLVRILRRLEIRGAWLAAALWALHPAQVESVAWMSELKNTLSGVFYFGAALVYLRFDRERRLRAYYSALGLFVLGLLTKSVIDTLPAALLLIFYWKNGKLLWRKDVRPLIPFFGIGIGSGLFTAWFERTLVGAGGSDFHLSLLERSLIAGRAFWFYLGKLIWPANLIFIYPRWQISASVWWQFLFPITALALMVVLASMRKQWGRAPMVAALYFAGTLFPALGFVNLYPFRYSFVADHFQYVACVGPLVLAAAGAVFMRRMLRPVVAGGLIAALGFLTWKQCAMYSDVETLWRTTLARNPGSWMAHDNLAGNLFLEGRAAEAIPEYDEALRLKPDSAEVHDHLGGVFFQQGRTKEANAEFGEAVRLDPDYAEARDNLGNTLILQGRTEEAIAQFREAVRIKPDYAEARYNLGLILFQQGRIEEATAQYREAVRIKPDYAEAHCNLGVALLREERMEEAAAQFRETLGINPNYAEAHNDLSIILFRQGRMEEGMAECREALRLKPDNAEAHDNLGNALLLEGRTQEAIAEYGKGLELQPANAVIENELAWLLATTPQASLRNGARALELALKANQSTGGGNPVVLRTLAAAYAETGDFSNAAQTASSALKLAETQSNTGLADALRREIKLYQTGHRFEEAH